MATSGAIRPAWGSYVSYTNAARKQLESWQGLVIILLTCIFGILLYLGYNGKVAHQ